MNRVSLLLIPLILLSSSVVSEEIDTKKNCESIEIGSSIGAAEEIFINYPRRTTSKFEDNTGHIKYWGVESKKHSFSVVPIGSICKVSFNTNMVITQKKYTVINQ